MRTMKAGEFKAKCLKLIDEVAMTGEPVVVTKRGVPKVWVVFPGNAVVRDPGADSIFGCLQHMISPTDELDDLAGPIISEKEWDLLKSDRSPFSEK